VTARGEPADAPPPPPTSSDSNRHRRRRWVRRTSVSSPTPTAVERPGPSGGAQRASVHSRLGPSPVGCCDGSSDDVSAPVLPIGRGRDGNREDVPAPALDIDGRVPRAALGAQPDPAPEAASTIPLVTASTDAKETTASAPATILSSMVALPETSNQSPLPATSSVSLLVPGGFDGVPSPMVASLVIKADASSATTSAASPPADTSPVLGTVDGVSSFVTVRDGMPPVRATVDGVPPPVPPAETSWATMSTNCNSWEDTPPVLATVDGLSSFALLTGASSAAAISIEEARAGRSPALGTVDDLPPTPCLTVMSDAPPSDLPSAPVALSVDADGDSVALVSQPAPIPETNSPQRQQMQSPTSPSPLVPGFAKVYSRRQKLQHPAVTSSNDVPPAPGDSLARPSTLKSNQCSGQRRSFMAKLTKKTTKILPTPRANRLRSRVMSQKLQVMSQKLQVALP